MGKKKEAEKAPEKAENLPRGRDAMTGLWPGAILMQTVLQEDVKSDEMAEEVLAWISHLEARKEAIRRFCDQQVAKCEQALTALAETPAVKSLPEYVKESTGKKTLRLPSGTVKVRVQRDVLRVYDEKTAKVLCPEAIRQYQAPARDLLDKPKLKELLKERGPLTINDEDEGKVVVAEVLGEVETLQTQPNGDGQGARAPRLLEREEVTHEDGDEKETGGRAG